MAANVKASKRFLSTIARRLDTLGAITRGQRQTGGAGLFRAEDNLESPYARAALRQFYHAAPQGKIEGCSLMTFEAVTGLSLTTDEGGLRDELPPITTWLNRLLALTHRDAEPSVRGVRAADDARRSRAPSRPATTTRVWRRSRRRASSSPIAGPSTRTRSRARSRTCSPSRARIAIRPLGLVDALAIARAEPNRSCWSIRVRAARPIQLPTASLMLDDGAIEHRVRLLRPTDELRFGLDALAETHWQPS